MGQRPLADRVAAVSALDEPIRRALFDHVSRVDVDDVGHTLEDEGVASFHDSFQHMLASLAAKARQLSSR